MCLLTISVSPKSYGLDVWIVTYDNGPDFESERGEATELRFPGKYLQTSADDRPLVYQER